MGTVNTRTPKERKPGPYEADRACRVCGAKPLSRNNPSDICAPCNRGEWEEGEATTRQLHDVQVARLEYGLAA